MLPKIIRTLPCRRYAFRNIDAILTAQVSAQFSFALSLFLVNRRRRCLFVPRQLLTTTCHTLFVTYNIVEDNVAVLGDTQAAALVKRVSANDDVAQEIQHDTQYAQYQDIDGEVHGVARMVQVNECLKGLNENGEAPRGEQETHDKHRQDIDACPAECVVDSL